jgi:hypothetical protein
MPTNSLYLPLWTVRRYHTCILRSELQVLREPRDPRSPRVLFREPHPAVSPPLLRLLQAPALRRQTIWLLEGLLPR